MPKTHVSADPDLTITPPELRRIADYQGKPRTGAQGEIKALPAQVQDVGRLSVRYELAQSGGRQSAPVMLAVSFTPDEQSIRAIKLVAIDDVNLALDNARLHGGEWQAKFQRQGLIQYTEQEGEQEIIPISIDMIAVENGISCIIRSKYFTLTSLYRNKLNRFETFDYKELSDEEKTKQIHRPRDEWPDPSKPRYANVNRTDVRHDTRIEADTAERLDAFLDETGMTKKAATDEALNRLIDAYELEHGIKLTISEPE